MNTNEEIWKSVVGWEGRYEVSNFGRVRCIVEGNHGQYPAGRIIKSHPHQNHYLGVMLYGPNRMRSVHSLVLEAFKGPRPTGYVSRHLDGVRTHNTSDNLAWGTSAQNAQDAREHGTFVIGSKNGRSIIDESDVKSIRDLKNRGLTYKEIGDRFGTHFSNVWLIVKKRTWTHVP